MCPSCLYHPACSSHRQLIPSKKFAFLINVHFSSDIHIIPCSPNYTIKNFSSTRSTAYSPAHRYIPSRKKHIPKRSPESQVYRYREATPPSQPSLFPRMNYPNTSIPSSTGRGSSRRQVFRNASRLSPSHIPDLSHSTVTLFARFLGLSTSSPFATLT